jgi:glucokinase
VTNSAVPGASVPGATVLGIDVGGTTVKARLVSGGHSVLGEWREPTPTGDATAGDTIALVADLVARASNIAPVDAVGLVVPGIVDELAGIAVHSVNVGWRDVALRSLVEGAIGLPLAFAQDVRAGALAEATSGAAAGVAGPVVFVPVGTGLAAAILIDGAPLVSGGWAGEIGQVVIQHGPHAGARVEEIASAGGIARRLGLPDARAAAVLVRGGDPAASAVWLEAVDVLADSLAWITAVVAPTTIVVGGGLAESGDLLFDPLARALDARLGIVRRPDVVRAVHGEAAAVIGALHLARAVLA